MKIGLYISDLLHDHDSVIFPGLGLFSVQAKPARFSDNQDILSPPGRKLRFIPDVQINDGMLLNYYAQRMNLTTPEAYSEIVRICDEIHYLLDHGDAVVLEGLGELRRMKGTYYFEALPEAEIDPDTFGLEPVNLLMHTVKKDSQAVAVAGNMSDPSRKTVSRARRLYWLSAIPVLVIAGFFFWRYYPVPVAVQPVPETPAVIAEESVSYRSDPEVTDIVQESDTIAAPAPALPVHHPQRGLHYLVGGSFKTRENADQYMEILSRQGSESIYLGEIQGFHVVAVRACASAAEAAAAQRDMLRENPASGAWVYHLPGVD